MEAILISLFILSCYVVWKIGLRVYHVRQYLKLRSRRLGKANNASVLQAEFSGRYHQLSQVRVS